MKESIVAVIRNLMPPSMRFQFGEWADWFGEQLNRAKIWNWEVSRFRQAENSPFQILFLGRKSQHDLAKALLHTSQQIDPNEIEKCDRDRCVIISEFPFPGSMVIPSMLSSVVPLDRTIDEITENYHSQLRRELHKNRSRYRLRQALENDDIELADREMLRPYALARHGVIANQIGLDELKRMARKYGRLDFLLYENEPVGCQQGFAFTRKGKRYWSTNRCGYPESVFSIPKRLRDFNSFNIFLAMEWALENGYDYYDIGLSLGRPGDGLLEWKRRRGGELDTLGNSLYFHIRLPKIGADKFLWDAPLFAVEKHKLTLHLGLPHGPSDEEIASHYREMAFGGLHKVYLHTVSPTAEHIIEMIRNLYAHQKSPPVVEIISAC